MLITCWVADALAWGGSWWLLQWPSLKLDPPGSSLHLSQSFVTLSDLVFVWWAKTADLWHQGTWKKCVFSMMFSAASTEELSKNFTCLPWRACWAAACSCRSAHSWHETPGHHQWSNRSPFGWLPATMETLSSPERWIVLNHLKHIHKNYLHF